MPAMWADVVQAVEDATLEAGRLLDTLPEDVAHTATRNRIVMAQVHLDEARDMLAAAKDRLPK